MWLLNESEELGIGRVVGEIAHIEATFRTSSTTVCTG